MAYRFSAVEIAVALVAAGLAAVPVAASAQSGAAPKTTDMKGSPNANGYGSERGMDKSDAGKSAPNEKGSDERPAAKEMQQTPK